MKHLSVILLAWMINFQAGKDLYVCKNVNVTLFSSAPIEDIRAETSSGASVFNAATGELNFVVSISSFKFPKSLMQEHFNENYPKPNFLKIYFVFFCQPF